MIRFTLCIAGLSLQDIKLKRGDGKKDLIMRSFVDNAVLCMPKSPSVIYLSFPKFFLDQTITISPKSTQKLTEKGAYHTLWGNVSL